MDMFNVKRDLRSSHGSPAYRHMVAVFIVVPYPNQMKSTSRNAESSRLYSFRQKHYNVLNFTTICQMTIPKEHNIIEVLHVVMYDLYVFFH